MYMARCYKNISRRRATSSTNICNKMFGLLKQQNLTARNASGTELKIAILRHGIPINKMANLTVKNCTLVSHLVL